MQPDRERRTAQLIPAIRAGDRAALSEAVELHTPLVHAMMARVPGTQDPSDLFQNGCIGLILALKKFEPERGFAFSTYAVPYILGEMRKPLRSGGAVHLSRSLIQQLQQLTHFREELRAEKGQEASLTEVSQKAGMSPEEAAFILCAAQPVQSLNETASPEETEPLQLLTSPDNTQEEALRHLLLHQAFSCLEPREARLLYLRYFLDRTQTETAKALHISQVQVSRLEKKILLKLRQNLQDVS